MRIKSYEYSECDFKEFVIPEGVEVIGESAFSKCKNLTKIVFPSTLKRIGEFAFSNCVSLKEVIFNEGLELIDGYSFVYCINLKKIYIPSTIKKIKFYAFQGCDNVKNIEFASDIKKIPENIACNLNIKEITIPESVTEIGSFAFSGCKNLSKVIFPKNLEIISYNAFSETKLKNIEIPENVKIIGSLAFYNCKKLTKINFPKSLKKIGYGAFQNCINANTFELNEGLEEIGKDAFLGTNFSKIRFPSTLKKIGEGLFANCEKFTRDKIEIESENFKIKENCLVDKKETKLFFTFCEDETFVVPSFIKRILKGSINRKIKDVDFSNCNLEYLDYESAFDLNLRSDLRDYLRQIANLENAKKDKLTEIKKVGTNGLISACFEEKNIPFTIRQDLTKTGTKRNAYFVKFALSDSTKVYMTIPFSIKNSSLKKVFEFDVNWNEKQIDEFLTDRKIKHQFLSVGYEKEMVTVPSGIVSVKRASGTGYSKVSVSSFLISKYDVTQEFYEKIVGFLNNGTLSDKGENKPVNCVNWYDAIIFCNKLSESEGLEKCYSINGDSNVFNWGIVPDKFESSYLDSVECDFSKNGYRLPTIAEWKLAALGGNPQIKNYYSGGNKINDFCWHQGNSPDIEYGSPDVGLKLPNELGIYDMSGLNAEWCFDWASGFLGEKRARFGGDWSDWGYLCAVSKDMPLKPQYRNSNCGIRLVRTINQK